MPAISQIPPTDVFLPLSCERRPWTGTVTVLWAPLTGSVKYVL
jgi:hypothetical protein